MKRIFDIIVSFIGLLILLPFLLILALAIILDSKGGVFYRQLRVGKNGKPFRIFKFRSMRSGSDKKGLLTVGNADMRITKVGKFIRKYKLDEFAQLINVLTGDMSLVGPRPEVPKYVDMYTTEQKEVLKVKPGITDYASIEYSDENELLAKSENPEKTYIEEIMPAKLALNKKYIENISLKTDIQIIWMTFRKVF
ncbi:MAG: sugar transferase [Bacteroidales bacterium]|nr:sugar transferase [Bacteroidales bacterium]